jgi:ribosome-binding protein aMBF1 (putative translation factor)
MDVASLRNQRAARLLRELRIDQGLSAEALAFEIYRRGAGPIRRIEELGTVPTPRVQFALAAHFGLKPTQLWQIQQERAVA